MKTTPNELAAQLGISPKALRAWLRSAFPRPESEKWTRWKLDDRMIRTVRAQFRDR